MRNILHFIKLILTILLCCCMCCSTAFANMAKPWIESSSNGNIKVYGAEQCVVNNELIHIKLLERDEYGMLQARFTVTYNITANEQTLPLLFIGEQLQHSAAVTVNGKSRHVLTPDSATVKKWPFIVYHKVRRHYYAVYKPGDSIAVGLNELLYFNAALKKGSNTITVEYTAAASMHRFTLWPDYTFEYSLYPSRFWKSFGPIDIQLDTDGRYRLTKSSLPHADAKGNLINWRVQDSRDSFTITVNPRLGIIQRAIVFIDALGIAIMALIIMAVCHVWFMQRFIGRIWLWLGSFLIPLAAYFIYFAAHNFIGIMLRTVRVAGGYIGLWFITYPLAVLVYAIIIAIIRRRLRQRKTLHKAQ